MRSAMVLFCFSFLLSCANNPVEPAPPFDSMLFVRQGGGDKAFSVYPTNSADTFHVTVTHFEFRDTTVQLSLARDNGNAAAFDALTQTLHGKSQLFGDFEQSTLPTGTWSYLYVVKGAQRYEITNTDLRNVLSGFENIVKAKMQP